jgi:anti-sigma B factor antagonist
MYPVLVRERDDATVVIRLSGEIDALNCDEIESTIVAATLCWEQIVIDINDVAFCCSSGLSMFVRCQQAASERGAQLALVNPSPPVQRVIEVTGLRSLLAA